MSWEDKVSYCGWDEIWDNGTTVLFRYEGHRYFLSLEVDRALYDDEDTGDGEILMEYKDKEDFYNSTFLGKPIKEILDNADIFDVA